DQAHRRALPSIALRERAPGDDRQGQGREITWIRGLKLREGTIARRHWRITDDLKSLRPDLGRAIWPAGRPSDLLHAVKCADPTPRVVVELQQRLPGRIARSGTRCRQTEVERQHAIAVGPISRVVLSEGEQSPQQASRSAQ